MKHSTFQKRARVSNESASGRVPLGAASPVNALVDVNCDIEQLTVPLHRRKSYGDRFVPSRLADDMRTYYNLSQVAQSNKRKNRENELPDPRKGKCSSN